MLQLLFTTRPNKMRYQTKLVFPSLAKKKKKVVDRSDKKAQSKNFSINFLA